LFESAYRPVLISVPPKKKSLLGSKRNDGRSISSVEILPVTMARATLPRLPLRVGNQPWKPNWKPPAWFASALQTYGANLLANHRNLAPVTQSKMRTYGAYQPAYFEGFHAFKVPEKAAWNAG
jgi:hypothetical protein